MATALDPLHHEHDDLRPKVEALRATADAADTATTRQLGELLATNRSFLEGQLLPHATVEEAVLYPEIQRVMGSVGATVGMEHDHGQIRTLTAELAESAKMLAGADEVSPELARRLRRELYGLYAVIANHLEKEEQLYLPRLRDGLGEAEAAALVARMASHHAHHTLDLDAADGG